MMALRQTTVNWKCWNWKWNWIHSFISAMGILSACQSVFAVNVNPQHENYIPDYQIYHNLSDIAVHLRTVASKHSDIIHIDWNFRSRKGVSQILTQISNFSLSSQEVPKVRILLSYGEHAREFFPVESFFYLLKNLTDGLASQEGSYAERYSRMILSHFDIYVIVIANPDGRHYVETSGNFCWRGTSTGVDINRNFDWQFAKKGSSSDPKDEEFRGPRPFSGVLVLIYMSLL